MKTINYELIGRLQEIVNNCENQMKEAEAEGLYAEALDYRSAAEQTDHIIALIKAEYVEEDTDEKYIEITKDNYKEYLGSKVEVSDDNFGTSVTYTLVGYNEYGEYHAKFPIICGFEDNLITYRRARVKREG